MTDKVKITPKLAAALESQRSAFVAKFGREPNENDPLIFDPDFDTPIPMEESKLTAQMVAAMKAAGTPGHLIYAYEVAGLILTEETYASVPPDARKDWDAAIGKWESMSRQQKRQYLR